MKPFYSSLFTFSHRWTALVVSRGGGRQRSNFPGLLLAGYFLLSTFCGCGYAPLNPTGEVKTLAVPIFENKTFWRGYEFELTNLVQNEILTRRLEYQLISDPTKSDLVLAGEITDISKPVLVEGVQDRTIQSQMTLTLKIAIKDQRTGKIIHEAQRTESGEFVGQRAENEDSARRKASEKLARWVTVVLENIMTPE